MYQRFLKRWLDATLSLLGLVLLSPLLVLVLCTLAIVQGRPVFFSQVRVGRQFVPFKLYKLRSMRVSNAEVESEFSPQLPDRRTPIGRILRATKVDELPQLWNVVRGDMALVGPRPEVPQWVDTGCAQWQQVLSVRPGMTDTASLQFFDEESQLRGSQTPEALYREVVLPEKLRLACVYVHNITLIDDLRIVARTVWQLLKGL